MYCFGIVVFYTLSADHLKTAVQRHYREIQDEFDLMDVIDELLENECINPEQHTQVRNEMAGEHRKLSRLIHVFGV